MNKKIYRIVAIIMFLFLIGFILFAFNHPELSFPWQNSISYILYVLYIAVMIVFFVIDFINNK